MWERITRSRDNSTRTTASISSISTGTEGPLAEQARRLQAFQQRRAPTTSSAVEEQARMLRQYQPSRSVNPIEEQAKRLLEIQDDKEKE